MNRRHLLAGAAALPVAGLVAPAAAASDDPAVRAYREWRNAFAAELAALRGSDDWETPEVERTCEASRKARVRACEAVATTPAGLACQTLLAFYVFGQVQDEDRVDDPDAYAFGDWIDDIERKLLRSILAGAERMA